MSAPKLALSAALSFLIKGPFLCVNSQCLNCEMKTSLFLANFSRLQPIFSQFVDAFVGRFVGSP